MSSYHFSQPSPRVSHCAALFNNFFEDDRLPISGVLTPEQLQRHLHEHHVDFGNEDGETWNGVFTLLVFVIQCLSKDKSCAAAVAEGIGLLITLGYESCSSNTGAYCKARAKLPEPFLRSLALEVGWEQERQGAWDWRLAGHRTFLVDGSTITLPDTAPNQERYPQQSLQKPGLGYPILRILLIFSQSTGAVVAVAWGPYQGKQTGENALMRGVWDVFQPGDLLLADGLFADYFTFLLARRRGLHLLFFAHHKRLVDFRKGTRLGTRDHVVGWAFPARPSWMAKADYDRYCQETQETPLQVRELEVNIRRPGFRTKTLRLATTLTDASAYPKALLASCYRQRWNAELDIRNLKTLMQMEHLRCKTPEMAHREIWTNLLAYNLIRKVIAQAASKTDKIPRTISFNFARQSLEKNLGRLASFAELDRARYDELLFVLLEEISKHRVSHRPDRVEPRAVKRRPKPHDLMTKPRAEAKAELLAS